MNERVFSGADWSRSRYSAPHSWRGAPAPAPPSQARLAELNRTNRRQDTSLEPYMEVTDDGRRVIHVNPAGRAKKTRHRQHSDEPIYADDFDLDGNDLRILERDPEMAGGQTLTQRKTSRDGHQTRCNPARPVNVNVQLQLPITLDLDEELEELARLRRMGDFRAAKTFFSSKLAEHIDKPYVFIQYADLLLTMEDYKTLKSLQPPPEFGVSIEEEGLWRARLEKELNTDDFENKVLDADPRDESALVQWNWMLIKALVLIHTEDCVSNGIKAIDQVLFYLNFEGDLGSTEVQIIILCLRIYIAASYSADQKQLTKLNRQLRAWIDWDGLFVSLSTQNRHGDCSDLKAADAIAFGYRQDWNWRTNGPGRDKFDFDFTGPWDGLHHDEASLLACLDQTTSICLVVFTAKPSSLEYLKRSAEMVFMMNMAAQLLKRHYPAAMRSQPFIRWLIVSSQVAGEKADELATLEQGRPWWGLFHNLASPGAVQVLGWRDGINLPIYVPRGIEVPKWDTPENPPRINEALHLALNMAREMDDYPTQAICYKLLALRSKEPRPLLESLCRLQEAHGDRTEYLKTLLSSYIGLDDVRSLKRLLDKLTDFRDTFGIGVQQRADIEVHWAHDVVKRALRARIDGRHHQDIMGWVNADYVRWLPRNTYDYAMRIRANRSSLVHRSGDQDAVHDRSLQRTTSAMERQGERQVAVANNRPTEETLLEKNERWIRELTRLKAAKKKEMRLAALARSDNGLSSTRQEDSHSVASSDESARTDSGHAAAKDRQLILWKGDYRNHEQWLALNKGELDPADYYRKWAVRNPDALRRTGTSEPVSYREREDYNAESDPPPDDSGDESLPESDDSVPPPIEDSENENNLEDEESQPQDRLDLEPGISSETRDHVATTRRRGSIDAPDSRKTHIIDLDKPVTDKEAPSTGRQPTAADRPKYKIKGSTTPQPIPHPTQPLSMTSFLELQGRGMPSGNIGTRPKSTGTDADSGYYEASTTRGSQDGNPYEIRSYTSRSDPRYDSKGYGLYPDREARSDAAESASARLYESPRMVRWADHERRRQNDRIGSRPPSVPVSDGPFYPPPPLGIPPPLSYATEPPSRRRRTSIPPFRSAVVPPTFASDRVYGTEQRPRRPSVTVPLPVAEQTAKSGLRDGADEEGDSSGVAANTGDLETAGIPGDKYDLEEPDDEEQARERRRERRRARMSSALVTKRTAGERDSDSEPERTARRSPRR